MSGEVGAEIFQRKGEGVFGDDIVEQISGSGGLIWGSNGITGGICCEFYIAHY